MERGGKGDFFWGDDLAYQAVKPDRIVGDGERVELGGVSLTAHLTPGHTKGCTSWSMRANESGKDYDVLFVCGLTESLAGKAVRQRPEAPNPFIDPSELARHVTEMETDFNQALQAQERQR